MNAVTPKGNQFLSDILLYDKYARWRPEDQRRETWGEVVARVMRFFRAIPESAALPHETWRELSAAMLAKDVLPSMRVVQMAGPALERCNVGAYNCAYTALDGPRALAELLYILMQGTGVGYSVERRYVDLWPVVEERVYQLPTTFTIPDTTEGWCDAFYQQILACLRGHTLVFDASCIRPEGAWLRTKGGTASGPAPLLRLLETTRGVIRARVGQRLRPFDIHRLATLCGSIVQVGGVRRAAEICLFDEDDEQMRTCKDGDFNASFPELAMANNSMVLTGPSEDAKILRLFSQLASTGSGEPGLFRRDGKIPDRREYRDDLGSNPCFAAGTLIETVNGRVPIEQITTRTKVYTMLPDGSLGVRPATAAWKTKRAATLGITVGNYTLHVTPNHKIYVAGEGWKEAGQLVVGDTVVCLLRQRRGAAYSGIKLTSEADWRMEHRVLWEAMYGPLPSGWDVHHEDGNTHNNALANLRPMPHKHHAYLTSVEQSNNHQVKGAGGRFISPPTSRRGMKRIVGLPAELKAGLHQYAVIAAITPGPETDVYDLSVEETHNVIANGIVAHNCGEIILRPRQFCNLSIAVVRPGDTLGDLHRKVRLASVFGTLQSCLTKFSYLSPAWKENSEEERLLGVDITGSMDALDAFGGNFSAALSQLKDTAVRTNAATASLLGISPSTAVTCNKPSGNSSQFLDTSSGIHARYAPYYLRRIRLGAKSPLALHLQRLGLVPEPEVGQGALTDARVWVFTFPIASPEKAVVRNRLSAVDQLYTWLQWKLHWTEHNPSCTIYVSPTEWVDVAAFVKDQWQHIGGLSFMPKDTHTYALAPYEEIGKREYEKRLAALPVSLRLEEVRENTDLTTVNQEYACVGGICEI